MRERSGSVRFLTLLLSVVMMCTVIPVTVFAEDDEEYVPVIQTNVPYYDARGNLNCTPEGVEVSYLDDLIYEAEKEEASTIVVPEGWYLSNYSTAYQRMEVRGDVHIILESNGFLYAHRGIRVSFGNSLTIYSQDLDDIGYVQANAYDDEFVGCAAIGGNQGELCGNIEIHYCDVYAEGGTRGAGIGTGGAEYDDQFLASYPDATHILLNPGNDGSVTAKGGEGAAGIGGGFHGPAARIYIQSGNITASGMDGGAGIGGGYGRACNYIQIDGGYVKAIAMSNSDGEYAAGIGNGYEANPSYSGDCLIKINGGRVTTQSYGGHAILFSESENTDEISANAASSISIYENAKVAARNNNNVRDVIAHSTEECIDSVYLSIEPCTHERGHYDVDVRTHTLVCPDCFNEEFEAELHTYIPSTNICSKCGYGAGAVLKSVNIDFGGALSLQYSFSFSQLLLADEGAYVAFISKSTGDVLKKVYVSEGETENGITTIEYPFMIPDAGDVTIVKVFDGNGNPVSFHSGKGVLYSEEKPFEYSPLIYASKMKSQASSEKMRYLAERFEFYGLSALYYFRPDDYYSYPNKPYDSASYVSQEEFELFKPQITYTTENGGKPSWLSGASIVMYFEADHTLRITFFLADEEDISAFRFYLDSDTTTTRAMKTQNGGYALEVTGIAAPDLGVEHTFTISKGNEKCTITASAMTYAYVSYNSNSQHQGSYTMMQCLYYYYQSASEYFD